MGRYWEECGQCGGSGKDCMYHDGVPYWEVTCDRCGGEGGRWRTTCRNCGGSGRIMDYHAAEPQGWVNCPECS